MADDFNADPQQMIDPNTGQPYAKSVPLDQVSPVVHGAVPGIKGVDGSPGIWNQVDSGAVKPKQYGSADTPNTSGSWIVPGGLLDKVLPKSMGGGQGTAKPPELPAPDVYSPSVRWTGNPDSKGSVQWPDPPPLAADAGNAQPPAAPPLDINAPAARSADDPGGPRDPQGTSRADPPPSMPTFFGMRPPEGMLGDLFRNIGNYRDQHRMELMALAGGLSGSQNWGTGLGRGFTAAANAMPTQNALNNQNASINFLMSPRGGGYDMNTARAISANPKLMQAALGTSTGLTPPETSTVVPGQLRQAWIPGKGYVPIPPGGGMPGASSGGAPGAPGAPGAGNGYDLYNNPQAWDAASVEDRLAAVQQIYGGEYAASVRALGEGRYLPPNRQGQVWETAQHVYGMLDQGAIKARQDAYKKFYGGGDVDKRLTSFNQAFAQHGGDLPEAIEANKNFSFGGRLVNQPLGEAGRLVGSDTTLGPLQTNAKAMVDEVAGLWKASGSTDAEIQGWHDAVFNDLVYGSPAQQKAALGKLSQLGEGAIKALEDQKQRDFGPAAASMPPLVSPATRQAIDKIKAWTSDPKAKWQGGPASAGMDPRAINVGAIIEQAGHHFQHLPDGTFKQID